MGFIGWLSPYFLLSQLRQIDESALEERKTCGKSDSELRVHAWKLIGMACLCLLFVHYVKFSYIFFGFIDWLDRVAGADGDWVRALHTSEYRKLYGHLWWGIVNLLGFLIVPMMAVRIWFRESLNGYGWQWGEVHLHWRGYLLLAIPIVVFAIIASFGDEFSRVYPFYGYAHRSWFDLLIWEVIYILQFVAVEFFFRGYLLHGLRPMFGSLSIAIMCMPYLMLHFPKLWPESFGAILFGFFLGVLALMSRSIWGGVMVHVSIALTMDIAALLQKRGLPDSWL